MYSNLFVYIQYIQINSKFTVFYVVLFTLSKMLILLGSFYLLYNFFYWKYKLLIYVLSLNW